MNAARHWRTHLDPDVVDRYDCGALHVAFFAHRHDPGGQQFCIGIQVPEASRSEVDAALGTARRHRTRIVVVADTAEQVTRTAARIERRCPDHRRMAYERATAGALGPVQ